MLSIFYGDTLHEQSIEYPILSHHSKELKIESIELKFNVSDDFADPLCDEIEIVVGLNNLDQLNEKNQNKENFHEFVGIMTIFSTSSIRKLQT